jgi:hypothetical protein
VTFCTVARHRVVRYYGSRAKRISTALTKYNYLQTKQNADNKHSLMNVFIALFAVARTSIALPRIVSTVR